MLWIVAIPATVLFASGGSLVALVPRWRASAPWFARTWGRLLLRVAACPVRVEGLERVDTAGRYVIMPNHESALDIPLLLATLPIELRTAFWAKTSLFSVPFLGMAMRSLGFLPVDRVNRRAAVPMFYDSMERARGGRSVLVFPEETFGGEELLPFQRGGFLFALRTGMPILPVGIEGTREILPPGSKTIRRGRVVLRFGRPLETAGLGVGDRERLTEAVREAMEALRGSGWHTR